jgi:uncharacterized coiled-coil DUF342 family protein
VSSLPPRATQLESLERRVAEAETRLLEFEREAVRQLAQALRALRDGENAQDVRVREGLQSLRRQMTEIRERLAEFLGPSTVH